MPTTKSNKKSKIAPTIIYRADGPIFAKITPTDAPTDVDLCEGTPKPDSYDQEVLGSMLIKTIQEMIQYRNGSIGFSFEYDKAALIVDGSIVDYIERHPFAIYIYLFHKDGSIELVSKFQNLDHNFKEGEALELIRELCKNAELKAYLKKHLETHCELIFLNCLNHEMTMNNITKHYGKIIKSVVEHPFVAKGDIAYEISMRRYSNNWYFTVFPASEDYNIDDPICLNLQAEADMMDTEIDDFIRKFNRLTKLMVSHDLVKKKVAFEKASKIVSEIPEITR